MASPASAASCFICNSDILQRHDVAVLCSLCRALTNSKRQLLRGPEHQCSIQLPCLYNNFAFSILALGIFNCSACIKAIVAPCNFQMLSKLPLIDPLFAFTNAKRGSVHLVSHSTHGEQWLEQPCRRSSDF